MVTVSDVMGNRPFWGIKFIGRAFCSGGMAISNKFMYRPFGLIPADILMLFVTEYAG